MTRILAIETSCDETSAAIVDDGTLIKSNIVASQIASHKRFGGVVPEVASRHHINSINPVIDLALEEGDSSWDDIDAIAVTAGPGLVGALLIGITAAKTLAFAHQKPLIAVNHMAGHIYANNAIKPLEFPLMALIVSGGHTQLVHMTDHLQFEVIGDTRDDAVGEAYDKIGRVLGLPYPGGKKMDELAAVGQDVFDFPRAMIKEDNFDFSFSGLKSSVINRIHNAKQKQEELDPADVAASFQAAAVSVLVTKTVKALEEYPSKQLILAGGVAANKGLRSALKQAVTQLTKPVELLIPPFELCGDNAAMIGLAAYYYYQKGLVTSLDLNAYPGWDIDLPLG
ncbi:tRNA (adenosine(37)-N6)-threonylcarbamoyltransferase complex transferase subunit TsaD [Bavariicoccus seileri]|uniref:tRNA (adenosine(37)-N6)-threonylcarbamoyltransferase complex transferase subunit TsaD n=1 Tax=Bavariicoccus seileri TaxID=549685 RepID=UPI0003B3079E|nr:tRNA (adenosine(37)-N6)-threonylcarbamoyltransferase complex transferase subunit TsaD [Bavariicoccus seileri]